MVRLGSSLRATVLTGPINALKYSLVIATFIGALLFSQSCTHAEKAKTEQVQTTIKDTLVAHKVMLKDFYEGYLSASLKSPIDYEQTDALIDAHCTASLRQYLDTAELDYDPFLNAQDLSDAWQNTIVIKPHDKMPHTYWVHLDDPKNSNASVIVLLRMKQEGNAWKIDEILQ